MGGGYGSRSSGDNRRRALFLLGFVTTLAVTPVDLGRGVLARFAVPCFSWGMGGFCRFCVVMAAAAWLAACSSVSVVTTTATPIAPVPSVHVLDTLNDDIALAILVFDIPSTLEPVPDGSRVAFKLGAQNGETRGIDATLIQADGDEVMAALPPPTADRTYYLFGFSANDRQKLRDAQAWAKSKPAGSVQMQVDLSPALCTTEQLDPATTRFSILAILPNISGPVTLMNATSVADLATSRGPLPACAGHSG